MTCINSIISCCLCVRVCIFKRRLSSQSIEVIIEVLASVLLVACDASTFRFSPLCLLFFFFALSSLLFCCCFLLTDRTLTASFVQLPARATVPPPGICHFSPIGGPCRPLNCLCLVPGVPAPEPRHVRELAPHINLNACYL